MAARYENLVRKSEVSFDRTQKAQSLCSENVFKELGS